MRRRYSKPPLVEAVCEFQFKAESWDWTIPGLLYQQMSAEFPKKRENLTVHMQQSDKGELKPSAARRLHFMRSDERAFVEVGENLLALHQLEPYPGWQVFKPLIDSTFGRYLAVAHPAGLTRIGLRYVNRLRSFEDLADVVDRVNFWPNIPPGLPQKMNAMFARVELFYENDNGLLLLTMGSAAEGGVVLDLDFVTRAPEKLGLDEAIRWVETAHTRIEEAFEASLRDSARATFGDAVPVEEAS
jgi:uncharacterized protein (TIGR04255 family)